MTLFTGLGVILAVAGVGQAAFGGWTWIKGRTSPGTRRIHHAESRMALLLMCNGIAFGLIAVSMLGRPEGLGLPAWLRLTAILLGLVLLMVSYVRFGSPRRQDGGLKP
jgi:hypothetical protein